MSLIYTINGLSSNDLINEGLKLIKTGAVGAVTDSVIQAAASQRALVILGFTLTTDSASAIRVQLGFNSTSSGAFLDAMISTSTCINRDFSSESRIYGDDAANLVITSTGTVYYTINMRLAGHKVGVQYVEGDGAAGHAAPWFPEADRRVGYE